jgi:hypothetical protein
VVRERGLSESYSLSLDHHTIASGSKGSPQWLVALHSIESRRSRELSSRAIAGRVTFDFIDDSRVFISPEMAKQVTAFVANIIATERG